MNISKRSIEKLPFFHSFIQDSSTKVVIDIKTFQSWLEGIEHMDFLSNADEKERTEAYQELTSGGGLDLRDAMKEW